MKLLGYKRINGVIRLVTGLHIGGSTAIIEIGGRDNPVIKHPITKAPYIPGSSLKGKMRSLIELEAGMIESRPENIDKGYGNVHKWNGVNCLGQKCPVCVVFGTSADEANLGPTRLIVRDAFISDDYTKEQEAIDPSWSVASLMEDKAENSLNRITARANLRSFERVVPGVKFSFSMSYRVFDRADPSKPGLMDNGGTDENLFRHVIKGLRLVELDALGGAGSRGCGQVTFSIKTGEGEKNLSEINDTDLGTIFPTEPCR
ncbi:MAG: type III-A CRISPR-associated RAMP protein Csm3 [Deltaproteobacteria bacterium]|nr:type III-A CRISPR-associated RAMP protein Csm3 [Deltaproteobacteria bacterium]